MEQSPIFWIFNIAIVILVSALTIYSARNRKGAGGYLCEDCRFNSPADCLKSVRPFALVCTSYRQVNDGHGLTASAPAAVAISQTSTTSSTVQTPSTSEDSSISTTKESSASSASTESPASSASTTFIASSIEEEP